MTLFMMNEHHRKHSRSIESGSSSHGSLQKEEQFDLNLNMVDVTIVSSYDEESRWVESSAISLPPDVHEERQEKLKKLQQQKRSPQRSGGKGSSRNSSRPSDNKQKRQNTGLTDSVIKTLPKTDPLRHFNLLVLSQVFFLVGSSLFIAASWLEQHERSNNDRSSTFTGWKEQEPDETPNGYHLQISTSIDTYITKQMICMLGSCFCFLQVGFINVVRTPFDKFHFFQILAGFFGLLSSMFWETKSLYSDISYFFFVHAMTGQALLLLHSHFRNLVRPPLAELKLDEQTQERKRRSTNANSQPQRRFTFSAFKQQQGHFVFESSQEDLNECPSGLMSDDGVASMDVQESYPTGAKSHSSSDDGYSFSIENSFSIDQESYPGHFGEDNMYLQRPTEDHNDDSEESDATSVLRNKEAQEDTAVIEEAVIMLKFGTLFCLADSIFVLGSLIETALTYLTILVLPTQGDDENAWSSIARGINLIPGILWLTCASLTFLTTMWMRRHFMTTGATR